jgi:hypothetical protein
LELPKALELLVGIIGPGSQGVCAKLLTDLAINPQGNSRLAWDIAIHEAIIGLNDLRRVGPAGEGNGEFPLHFNSLLIVRVSGPSVSAAPAGPNALNDYINQSSHLLS